MSKPMIGFALVAVALLAGLLAFSRVEGYNPRAGVVLNLSRAEVNVYTQTRACPRPTPVSSGIDFARRLRPPGCRIMPGAFGATTFTMVDTSYAVRRVAVPLGVTLTACAALALVGVGLIAFGRPTEARQNA